MDIWTDLNRIWNTLVFTFHVFDLQFRCYEIETNALEKVFYKIYIFMNNMNYSVGVYIQLYIFYNNTVKIYIKYMRICNKNQKLPTTHFAIWY